MSSASFTLVRSIPISTSSKKNTLPRIILVASKDTKDVAQRILLLLPSVNITDNKHFISRRNVQNMFGANLSIPCPSTRHVVSMTNDTYEVKSGLVDKNGIEFFQQTPIYYDDRCLVEDKVCCKKQTKCKTMKELKTFVKLKMLGGKLQLATGTSNDIMRINIGLYCKCQT